MAALDSLGKPALSIGRIPPTAGTVDEYYNDSTGEGDHGEVDVRGPWNEGNGWKFVDAPAFNGGLTGMTGSKEKKPGRSQPAKK